MMVRTPLFIQKKHWEKTISEDFLDRSAPGEEVPPQQALFVQFTFEDLWNTCYNLYLARDDFHALDGQLRNITVTYKAHAWNNSAPASEAGEIAGDFNAAGGSVDIER